MAKTNKKILIVEDEKSILSLLQEKFISEGFSVATAQNGKKGLIATEKEKPDLILLDIKMPEMDGITMAKELKKRNNDTPIIFFTNLEDLKHIGDAVEINESDYLIKSDWKINEVVTKVKNKLDLK